MMKWLSERLRRGSVQKQRATAPRARPALESLEDRLVMSTLPSVEATPVFLGTAWQGQGWAEFALTAYTQGIVNSPFMDALQNAGYGVGRGKVTAGQTLLDSNGVAGGTVTDAAVRLDLFLGIAFGALPQPDANRLYTVFLPPNATFTATGTDGTHYSSASNLTGWNASFYAGSTQIHYVVIPFPGGTNVSANGQGNADAITESLSHEIAEAVTGYSLMADHTEHWHYRMSNGVAIQEVGQLNNNYNPIAVAGATPLKDISGWGTPS
jgi:hypothetical protein